MLNEIPINFDQIVFNHGLGTLEECMGLDTSELDKIYKTKVMPTVLAIDKESKTHGYAKRSVVVEGILRSDISLKHKVFMLVQLNQAFSEIYQEKEPPEEAG